MSGWFILTIETKLTERKTYRKQRNQIRKNITYENSGNIPFDGRGIYFFILLEIQGLFAGTMAGTKMGGMAGSHSFAGKQGSAAGKFHSLPFGPVGQGRKHLEITHADLTERKMEVQSGFSPISATLLVFQRRL
jgi:hypothetical protein